MTLRLISTSVFSTFDLIMTMILVSTTQTGKYRYAWRIPTSGTGSTATNWNTAMLTNTGGTFTSNPTINTTYYLENPPV